ncbi:MAG: DUF1194 domain-containing protein [Pseudomonadota bacterium]
MLRVMFRAVITACALSLGAPAWSCDIALVLAVDVSGSVDRDEYRIQMDGLAEALRDPSVADALLVGGAAIAVVQWTGTTRQALSVPWTEVTAPNDLDTLARRIEAVPREWRNYSTAIGEALSFSLTQFETAPVCARRVIDISGDGLSNEGVPPTQIHAQLVDLDVTVNALVIEGAEPDLTAYFRENVISGAGAFVITANSYEDYPDRMRRKLLREVSKPVSGRVIPLTGKPM